MREKLIELLKEADRYEFEEQKKSGTFSAEAGWKLLADHLIANGVTVQQWIPVTERLPTREDANETESILAIHKADGYVGRWIWDIVARYPKEFTHWMPLPQPPKEG
jgi:hypothetical protein